MRKSGAVFHVKSPGPGSIECIVHLDVCEPPIVVTEMEVIDNRLQQSISTYWLVVGGFNF